jgi:hypothetical protein
LSAAVTTGGGRLIRIQRLLETFAMMSAASLPQIDGLSASGLGLRDGLRSTMNGLVC